MKSDAWVITSTQRVHLKVIFEEELTREEAMRAFLRGDYDDVIDEDLIAIVSVEDAEVMG